MMQAKSLVFTSLPCSWIRCWSRLQYSDGFPSIFSIFAILQIAVDFFLSYELGAVRRVEPGDIVCFANLSMSVFGEITLFLCVGLFMFHVACLPAPPATPPPRSPLADIALSGEKTNKTMPGERVSSDGGGQIR